MITIEDITEAIDDVDEEYYKCYESYVDRAKIVKNICTKVMNEHGIVRSDVQLVRYKPRSKPERDLLYKDLKRIVTMRLWKQKNIPATNVRCLIKQKTTKNATKKTVGEAKISVVHLRKGMSKHLMQFAKKEHIIETAARALFQLRNERGIKRKRKCLVDEEFSKNWKMKIMKASWAQDAVEIFPVNKPSFDMTFDTFWTDGVALAMEKIANKYAFWSVTVTSLSFLAISQTTEAKPHLDVSGSEGRGFRMLVPILIPKGGEINHLGIYESKKPKDKIKEWRYRYDEGVLIGDDVWHCTLDSSYKGGNDLRSATKNQEEWFRLMLSVTIVGERTVPTPKRCDIMDTLISYLQPTKTYSWPGNRRSAIQSLMGKHYTRDKLTQKANRQTRQYKTNDD